MMFKTHLAFALFIGLLIFNYFDLNIYWFFILLLIGAGFADIDMPKSKFGRKIRPLSNILNFIFGHRKFIHSGLFLLIVGYAFYLFFGDYYIPFLIGYLSHLVLDSFSKEGINFIYPFRRLEIKGFLKTGSFFEKILFFVFLLLDIFLILIILK